MRIKYTKQQLESLRDFLGKKRSDLDYEIIYEAINLFLRDKSPSDFEIYLDTFLKGNKYNWLGNIILIGILFSNYEDLPLYLDMDYSDLVSWRLKIGY